MGKIPFVIFDITFCADGIGRTFNCAVNFVCCVAYCREVCSADIGFHGNYGWNDIDQFTAVGNNGMNADFIFIAEGFPLRMDTHHSRHCCIECVDTFMRCTARVRGFAEKIYRFGNKAQRATADKCFSMGGTYAFAGWDKNVVNCVGDATYTATYAATYIDYTVTFKGEDGIVISTQIYHYGDTVVAPADVDAPKGYAFVGWDKEVVSCVGDAEYTAVFTPLYTPGDVDEDGTVTDADALYLLRYTLFPDRYPVNQPADFDSDGNVTDADALYLLRYTLFPDRYPLP